MSKPDALAALAPWAGLLTAPVAWYAHQQGSGGLVYFRCAASQPSINLLAGLVALAVTAAAGAWSWTAWKRGSAAPAMDLTRFTALVSVLAAAVFCLAIGFQTLAGLLIPSCAR